MASISGDWLHSRSSSNTEELLTVRKLVFESHKPAYFAMVWSGGREGNPLLFSFASSADIHPSTMQTKIRAMIRYGFIRDGNTCPLDWTRMGNLWNELFTLGNVSASKQVYELTLAISLAIFAFNDSQEQYSINPSQGVMPLKFLFNNLDMGNAITFEDLEFLVDGRTQRVGKNVSYWKRDLINCGLFEEDAGRLVYTGKYKKFVDEIRNFEPNPLLTEADWKEIRDNPLIDISPFKDSIKEIFEGLSQEIPFEETVTNEVITTPLIEAMAEQADAVLPEVDNLNTILRFSNSPRRVRNASWALRVKRKYEFLCAVPNCDVIGKIFVEASHIKPDSAQDEGIPHRCHLLNGFCLCRHCHIAFDKGYFSLSDDHKIILSSRLSSITDQHLKTVITSSMNVPIKNRIDNKTPLVEFIQYHRINVYKE